MKKLLFLSLFLLSATLEARLLQFKVYRDNGNQMSVEAYSINVMQDDDQTLRTIFEDNNVDVAGFDVFNGNQFISIDLPLTQKIYNQLVAEHDRSQNIEECYIALFPNDEGIEE